MFKSWSRRLRKRFVPQMWRRLFRLMGQHPWQIAGLTTLAIVLTFTDGLGLGGVLVLLGGAWLIYSA